jgi:hypothetical protein
MVGQTILLHHQIDRLLDENDPLSNINLHLVRPLFEPNPLDPFAMLFVQLYLIHPLSAWLNDLIEVEQVI